MTYGQIYTKFLIEYDKADLTSSYPSLTEYEAATILDKAYLALIAQKITGNNARRSLFETDTKAISDLYGLVVNKDIMDGNYEGIWPNQKMPASNASIFPIPGDFLYFVGAQIATEPKLDSEGHVVGDIYSPVKLVSHESAEKFFETSYNKPWIKIPVCYIETTAQHVEGGTATTPFTQNAMLVVLTDPTASSITYTDSGKMYLTYIKKPASFAKKNQDNTYGLDSDKTFDCNDSMAEELISLAITFALENVESTRLNTKLNTRGLEA